MPGGPSCILAIAGPIVSGKDTAAEYCATRLGGIRISSSSDQYRVLEMFGVSNTREHVQALSLFLVNEYGQDTICRSVRRQIADVEKPVITDSVRRVGDIECLASDTPVHLVYLDASQDMRYAWFCKRGKGSGDTTLSREEFNRRDTAQTEMTLPDLKARASVVVLNNGTREEFDQKIEEALKVLGLAT